MARVQNGKHAVMKIRNEIIRATYEFFNEEASSLKWIPQF